MDHGCNINLTASIVKAGKQDQRKNLPAIVLISQITINMQRKFRLVGFFLFALIISTCAQQGEMMGKWKSYSFKYRGKEFRPGDKKDNTIIIFKNDGTYIRCHYLKTGRLHFTKFEEPRLQGVKHKKIKERGTFIVSGDTIVFQAPRVRDTLGFELKESILTLKYLVKDIIPNDSFSESFRKIN